MVQMLETNSTVVGSSARGEQDTHTWAQTTDIHKYCGSCDSYVYNWDSNVHICIHTSRKRNGHTDK